MADYTLGFDDPVITPDKGAGSWNTKTKTFSMRALKARMRISISLNIGAANGMDSALHLFHYLENTGNDYTIDLMDMINDVPSARTLYDTEVAEAKRFVETLPEGTHFFTSAKATGGYNWPTEDQNWYYAIGGYSVWGKGYASVHTDAEGKVGYMMNFIYNFYDRYNWDTGKAVTIMGFTVTDEFMGEFHRQGLAREYNAIGTAYETFTWGAEVDTAPFSPFITTPAFNRW